MTTDCGDGWNRGLVSEGLGASAGRELADLVVLDRLLSQDFVDLSEVGHTKQEATKDANRSSSLNLDPPIHDLVRHRTK